MPDVPLVSVVVPSYNQGHFIEDTIHSILAQDYPNIEIVVMDGGSQDGTLSVLRRYADRLTYVSEADDGQANAINKGFKRTAGSIVTWLNSDDIYPIRSAISSVVDVFRTRASVDFVYGDFLEIDANNRVLKAYRRPGFSRRRLLRVGYISQPATFFRRAVIETMSLREDLDYALDLEYWLRAANAGYSFRHIPVFLAAERLHDEAKCVRDEPFMKAEARRVREAFGATFDRTHTLATAADRAVMYSHRVLGIPAVVALRRASEWTIDLDAQGVEGRSMIAGGAILRRFR